MQLQELQQRIGKQIKRLRSYNEMTQEQVAEKLHIDRNAYGEIERGKTDIHLSRLVQIANFFGVETGELFDAKQKAVFYVTGTSNTQSNNQCNEYYGHSLEAHTLQHELEKVLIKNESLQKELLDKQRIIELLEDRISNK
jgi:transcriptional regulator with XRE-family HTH domain